MKRLRPSRVDKTRWRGSFPPWLPMNSPTRIGRLSCSQRDRGLWRGRFLPGKEGLGGCGEAVLAGAAAGRGQAGDLGCEDRQVRRPPASP